jgi:hypothetical protein
MARWGLKALIAITFCGIASPAFALETGQCLPAAQVRTALAAENMNPIILGNRTGYGYGTALIFMSNADGSRGYLVRGDKPLGEQAETICIDSVFRDVKLNDITNPVVPTWAEMGDDPVTAEAVCKRDRLGYQEKCNSNDRSLTTLSSNGQHVLFMAIGTAINPRDRTVRSNQRILLTLDGTNGSGLVKASTSEGASYILSAYTKGSLTQFAAPLIKSANR